MSRNYSSIVEPKALTADANSSATQITLNNVTGLPSPPYVLVINPDTANEEAVLVTVDQTGVTSPTLKITRAIETGATAKNHTTGHIVKHMIVGSDLQLPHDHLDNTTTAHGATGAVVGTTNAQTLTNKTLTTPKINENVTVTATSTELNVLDGITASTAELNIMDGVTATAAELNILDGATLTTTELNYVDGVTSSIQTQLTSNAPVGMVGMWVTGTAPTGWVLCQGQELAITGTYNALANVIGTTYGNLTNGSGGVGTTHFRLPDLRGRTPMGAGTGTGGGITGTGVPTGGQALTGRTLGGFTGDERRPQHNHGITDPSHAHGTGAGQNFATTEFVGTVGTGAAFAAVNGNIASTGIAATGITINNDGAGLSQNIQPSTVINFIIKF